MRRSRIAAGLFAMSSLVLVTGPAQAEDSAPSSEIAAAPTTGEAAPVKRSETVEIVGAAMFGVGYAPAFVMGAASAIDALGSIDVCFGSCRKPKHDGAVLLLPIAGPVLYADPSARDDFLRSGPPTVVERAALYGSAALQTAGLVTLLVGVMRTTPTRRAPKSAFSPHVSPSASGVAMAGTF